MFLSTYRPGYRPPWLEKSYATQLALRPLSPRDSLSVVYSVLQREQVLDPIAQVILSKAEGNPFFLEELTRVVMEHGDLRPTVAVPDTIQGVLMARIDRLPDEPKRLLQTASVLGRDFPSRLLRAIWEEPEVLEPYLRQLKQLEFLYEQSGGEEPVYVFKHALTQEVAYDSLLTPGRQALHAAAGEALEALYADRLEEAYDRLAYHYSKTEQTPKAVEYLTRSAEKAARSYAHTEAVTALQEALVHVERLPAEEQDRPLLDLVLRRAESLHFLGRRQESVNLLLQQQERLKRLEDPSLAGQYYFWLGFAHTFLGNREQAAQSLQRSLEEATRGGDQATMGRAHRALALESWFSGRPFDEAVTHGRQAVSLLERTEDRFWLGQALFALTFAYYWAGDFHLVLEAAARLDAIGKTTGSRRDRTLAAMMIGFSDATRGEWAAGIDACQRALELSPDPFETAVVLACLGKAYSEKVDVEHAIPVLEQAVQLADQVRSRQFQGWFRTLLGEAYLLNDQIEDARDVVRKGLEICTDVKFLLGIGLVQRALGRIAQAQGALAEAEGRLNEALQTFASIHARFELGRTHLDLAALAHSQGKREAVADHLNEGHSLFRALRVPKYVERSEQLAKEFGVPLE